jgi:drug/metabolite transporter (DMT)-like permease
MSWQLLTVINVCAMAASILLRRSLLQHQTINPFVYAIVFQGFVGIIAGAYALTVGVSLPDFERYWPAILATFALFAAAHIVSVRAFAHTEASVFTVFYATSAIWTMLVGAVLLDDTLTAQQLLGVLLFFVGIATLIPTRQFWKLDKGTGYSLATGALFGLAIGMLVYVGRNTDAATWNALSFIGPALLLFAVKPGSMRDIKQVMHTAILWRIILLATVMSIAALSGLLAFQRGNANVIAVLQQTVIVVSSLLAIVFLHERQNLLRKTVAAAICFVAVALIL